MSGSVADTWSGASYERIAETLTAIHDRVVDGLAVEPGARVLDVACGTGGVALRAARAGADVVGIDISTDQLAKARRAAEAEGLSIRFDEGDCQQLPYARCRVRRGRVRFRRDLRAGPRAHCSGAGARLQARWPAGTHRLAGRRVVGAHARAGRTFVEDADAREWSKEEHVRRLLGEAFDLELQTGCWRIEADSGAALWELVSTSMPPLRAWLAEQSDAARARAEQVYLDYLASGVLARNYVLVVGTRR